MKPYELTKMFVAQEPDMALLKKLYKKVQNAYLRQRLDAIEMMWEGKTRQEIVDKLEINHTTLITWMKVIVEHGVTAGLEKLVEAKTLERAGKLTIQQEEELIDIVRTKTPRDIGFEQQIFTGRLLSEFVKEKWGISVTDQTIYNILHRHKFSYQRAHRDYENADPQEQKVFAQELRDTLDAKTDDEDVFFLTNSL